MGVSEMNESAAPDEQPPYMEGAREMSFAQLARFIGNALERLSRPSASDDGELPRSQEELLTLCEMLRAKADAENRDAPVPQPPNYKDPDNPGPFTPSDKLHSLYAKRERYERHVEDAYGESQIVQEWTEDQLRKMEERELYPAEQRERRRHDKLVAEYEEARKPYREQYQRWAAEKSRWQEREANREATVRRLYREVKRAFAAKTTTTLPWEIAAAGEGTDNNAVYGYFRDMLSRGEIKEFDPERLDTILSLPWSHRMLGKAGWFGYIILTFNHTEKALMDCPVPNNAVYVLDSAEERLLKMKKPQLRASGETRRIYHTEGWFRRVERALDLP
jgi:hypothetical protein